MGGNDTHDKYGRPYELDDSNDILYRRLQDLREAANNFRIYLNDEIQELNKTSCTSELHQSIEILENFDKYFSGCEY